MIDDLVKRLRDLHRFAAEQKSRDWDEQDEIRHLFNLIFHVGYDAADRIEQLEAARDGAYTERNRLVALLASLFPSGIKKTAIPGWDEAWHGCVYIDLPNGQASWHYHDSEAHLFAHLPPYQGGWDGHSTEEKYARIAAIAGEKKDD